jgi:hypothetical protein
MLLFGEDVRYLSHLPMFTSLHHFQVLVEAGFDDHVRELVLADPEPIYTFVPLPFPIAELDPADGGPARSSLRGTVFRGHFERGGKPIAQGVVARIERVVYFRALDLGAEHAADRELTYLCFGRAGRLHLAHEITARPDFDHVLTARLVPGTATDQAGRHPDGDDDALRGFEVAVPVSFSGRLDMPADRLTPKERVRGLFTQTISLAGFHGFFIQVQMGREIYLEIDELGAPQM